MPREKERKTERNPMIWETYVYTVPWATNDEEKKRGRVAKWNTNGFALKNDAQRASEMHD